jgi:hypothetical protein
MNPVSDPTAQIPTDNPFLTIRVCWSEAARYIPGQAAGKRDGEDDPPPVIGAMIHPRPVVAELEVDGTSALMDPRDDDVDRFLWAMREEDH